MSENNIKNSKNSDCVLSDESKLLKKLFGMCSGLNEVLKELNPNSDDELELAKHLSRNLIDEVESKYIDSITNS